MDNFFENHRVNVEPHHVQEEEVPHLALLHNDVDALLLDQPEPDVEQIGLKYESQRLEVIAWNNCAKQLVPRYYSSFLDCNKVVLLYLHPALNRSS